MRNQKVIVILAIFSIASLSMISGCTQLPDENTIKAGEFIEVDHGVINRIGSINNLEISALDYKVYSSSVIKILQINFKITNKGKNETERFPDKIVIILNDGKQIEELIPTQDLFKEINKVSKVELRQGNDLYPGASANFQRLFLILANFDMSSTIVWMSSGDMIVPLQ